MQNNGSQINTQLFCGNIVANDRNFIIATKDLFPLEKYATFKRHAPGQESADSENKPIISTFPLYLYRNKTIKFVLDMFRMKGFENVSTIAVFVVGYIVALTDRVQTVCCKNIDTIFRPQYTGFRIVEVALEDCFAFFN